MKKIDLLLIIITILIGVGFYGWSIYQKNEIEKQELMIKRQRINLEYCKIDIRFCSNVNRRSILFPEL